MTNFGKSALENLTESLLLTSPDAAVARAGVIEYHRGMAKHEVPVLYQYNPAYASHLRHKHTHTKHTHTSELMRLTWFTQQLQVPRR